MFVAGKPTDETSMYGYAIAALGFLGHPFNPGHSVASITYHDGLTALPGQWQLVDL